MKDKFIPIWEIRKNGDTVCWSMSFEGLGYAAAQIADMEKHGLFLYYDGKRVRSKSLQFAEATR